MELCYQWGVQDRYSSFEIWKQLERSDEICKVLRDLTFTDFDGIIWIADLTKSTEDIVAWFRMLNRVRDKFPLSQRSASISIAREMQENYKNPSSEISYACVYTGNRIIDESPEIAWFFMHLYGERRALEVLRTLKTFDRNVSLASIYSLFERWDEFKDYDLSWALCLLETERNYTSRIEDLDQWKS